MLLVGSVIGSGIFFAPSIMAGYLQTPGLLLGLWILGGVLTLCGALSYAELAAAMPRAGGQYVFLAEAFSPLVGFLYGWTYVMAIVSGTTAAVAVAFAKTLAFFAPSLGEDHVILRLGSLALNAAQPVAIVAILFLTYMNIRGLRTGARIQNVFTVAKVAAIVLLLVAAVALRRGDVSHLAPLTGMALGPQGVSIGLFAALAGAMAKALFAYDAWFTVTFVAEEVKDPERTLPRALVFGTLGVAALYVGAVFVYLYMVPIGEMAGIPENSIATEAARRMMGNIGGAFIAAAIVASTFGCVNGNILGGARIIFAMARDRAFFAPTARVHERYRTPAVALALLGAISAVLTLTGTYSDLLTLAAFSSLFFNTLTVVALFVLRSKRPDLPRPYRTWGYPVTPALFLLVSLFFLVYIPVADPRNAFLGLGLTALGVPAYYYWHRRAPGVPAPNRP